MRKTSELMAGLATYEKTVRRTEVINLDVVAASIDLSGALIELVDQAEREFFLKKALEPLLPKYDYILIDCPPSLGLLTLNGLAAAHSVLIPMQCEYFALEGISLLLQTVKKVQKSINPDLQIGGIFFTMYDSRTRLANDVVTQVKAYFKDSVFATIIPRNVRLSEILVHAAHVADDDKDKRRQQPACENEQVLGFKPFELDRPADSLVNLPHGLQEKAS